MVGNLWVATAIGVALNFSGVAITHRIQFITEKSLILFALVRNLCLCFRVQLAALCHNLPIVVRLFKKTNRFDKEAQHLSS